MSKILITGGAGFIGLNLAKRLSETKNQIYLVDNLARGKKDKYLRKVLKHKNIKFLKVDLLKKFFLPYNFKYIFHLASTVGVKNVNRNPFNTIENNIIGTINLIKSLKGKNITKFICFSSSEVYAPNSEKNLIFKPAKENNNLLVSYDTKPRDSYYLSKLINEKIVALSGHRFLILRPHNIYGPRMGNSHVIPELLQKIKSKKKCKIYSPNHSRSFCFIEDAINQIVKLSFSNKTNNQIYNIGNMREEIKIYDLAKKIKKLLKNDCKLLKHINTPGSPKRRVPNMTKTLKTTRLNRFTNLNNGLSKTANWYFNEKN